MEQIQTDCNICAQNSDDQPKAYINDTAQEISQMVGEIKIPFQTAEPTTIQEIQSDSATKSNIEISSLFTYEIMAEAYHQSENIAKKGTLPETKSHRKLDDVFTSLAQSTSATEGIARSRKGMKLNDPQAFDEPPEMTTSIDIAPILPKLGCSTPSFVARLKQRVAEKSERFVSEVVFNTAVANASTSGTSAEAPAYDQPGNTSSPNDQSNVNSVNVEKQQSVINDSGDVSSPEKEETKDYLAPRWEEESNFRIYTAFPAAVESRSLAEDLMPKSDPHTQDLDVIADNRTDQLEFSKNVLPISSTRMLDSPETGTAITEPSTAVDKSYSGVELEILGGVKEGFNDISSDEEDTLEIQPPIYRVVSSSKDNPKVTKKVGIIGRMFGRVTKKIIKIKPLTKQTSESLDSSQTESPSVEVSGGSSTPKKAKKL